jgi:hypothetical protein
MSNRAVWNVRLRHESLTKEKKGKRMKRRTRLRNGVQEALDRSQPEKSDEGASVEE